MYNCKVITYADGSKSIRLYENSIKKHRCSKKYKVGIDKEETDEQRQARENLNMINSINRTKKVVGDLILGNDWDLFVTLTFDGNKVDRTDFKLCMTKVRVWLQNQRHDHAPDLKFIAVPEYHMDCKSVHVHVLMSGCEGIGIVDSGKVYSNGKCFDYSERYKDCPKVYNLSKWNFGYSHARKVDNNTKNHILNYLLKNIDETAKRVGYKFKRYYASHNLSKPVVETLQLSDDEKSELLGSFDQIEYRGSSFKYIKTDYYNVLG